MSSNWRQDGLTPIEITRSMERKQSWESQGLFVASKTASKVEDVHSHI